jgi:hypothetical protein
VNDDKTVYRFTERRLAALDRLLVPDPSNYRCPVCGTIPVYVAGYCGRRWNNKNMSCHSPIASLGLTCPTKDCAMKMHYSVGEWVRHSTRKAKKTA